MSAAGHLMELGIRVRLCGGHLQTRPALECMSPAQRETYLVNRRALAVELGALAELALLEAGLFVNQARAFVGLVETDTPQVYATYLDDHARGKLYGTVEPITLVVFAELWDASEAALEREAIVAEAEGPLLAPESQADVHPGQSEPRAPRVPGAHPGTSTRAGAGGGVIQVSHPPMQPGGSGGKVTFENSPLAPPPTRAGASTSGFKPGMAQVSTTTRLGASVPAPVPVRLVAPLRFNVGSRLVTYEAGTEALLLHPDHREGLTQDDCLWLEHRADKLKRLAAKGRAGDGESQHQARAMQAEALILLDGAVRAVERSILRRADKEVAHGQEA